MHLFGDSYARLERTSMKRRNKNGVPGFPNIDDHAIHLRKVHLTILFVCAGLFVGSFISINSHLMKACSDIQVIEDSIEKIDVNWLYDYARVIANECFISIDEKLPDSIFLDFPIDGGPILVQVDLPKDKWMVEATKDCQLFGYSSDPNFAMSRILKYVIEHNLKSYKDPRLEDVKTKLKMQMLKPLSTSAFKNFWDFISSPQYIYCAAKLTDSAILNIAHNGTINQETQKCKILIDKPKGRKSAEWKLTSELKLTKGQSESAVYKSTLDNEDTMCVFSVDEFSFVTEESDLFWGKKKIISGKERYRIEIPVIFIRHQIFPVREFIRITGVKKPEASFEIAFPELNQYVERYPFVSFSELVDLLKQLIESGKEYVDLLGMKIPYIYLTSFGLVVINLLSVYFLLHLNQLTDLGSKHAWDCSIAWIGMYNNAWAKIACVISLVILPLFVIIYLLLYRGTTEGLWNIVMMFGVSIQLLLSILVVRQFVKWWRVMRR